MHTLAIYYKLQLLIMVWEKRGEISGDSTDYWLQKQEILVQTLEAILKGKCVDVCICNPRSMKHGARKTAGTSI